MSGRSILAALDIGGTSFRLGLADEKGQIRKRCLGPTEKEPEECLKRIKEKLERLILDIEPGTDLRAIKGMGVGAAGIVELKSGTIRYSPHLPNWRDFPLKARLMEVLGVPVWVENDANLGALGEYRFGAGIGCESLVYLALGTGIGGGVIQDGELLTGAQVSAAEAGHMVIDPKGPKCSCGRQGCLEAFASGRAIASKAKKRVSKGEDSQIIELVNGKKGQVTGEIVIKAAKKGDILAKQVLQEAGRWLGIGAVNLILLFDPQVVIIGGGAAGAGEFLLGPARRVIRKRVSYFLGKEVPLRSAKLGTESNLRGAVALALNQISP